jgi:hypothetical protein
MDNIRTYSVGNGEITLTAQDAEELRILLQSDYMEYVINELIDASPKAYKFYSDKARRAFVNNMVLRRSDMRDIEGCFEEMLEDSMLEYAEDLGIRG